MVYKDIHEIKIPKKFRHNKPNQKKFARKRSIISRGIEVCICINKDNILVDGYVSYLVYKSMKFEQVPCIIVEDNVLEDKEYIRRKLFKKQRGICYLCNNKMDLNNFESDLYATIEHVVPKSKGGADCMFNLKCACKKCNHLKQDLSLEDYLSKVGDAIVEN